MATMGLDVVKAVFQVHGVGKCGSVVVQRRFATITGPGLLVGVTLIGTITTLS
jgi:hypothetical protein